MAIVFPPPDPVIDPCWDPVFKSIFTRDSEPSRAALRGFLQAVLGREIGDVAITANEPPVSGLAERQIRYDVNCTFGSGEKANVEMTLFPNSYDVLKMEYYLARLFTSQEISGEGRSYRDLRRCYQISLLGGREVFPDDHFCHWFAYHDRERGTDFGGRTAVVTLELNKLAVVAEKPVEELGRQERWGVFFRYYTDPMKRALMERILAAEEGIRMAQTVIQGFSRKELEKFHKISKEKYVLDMRAHRHEAEEQGLVEGRAQGQAEGREQEKLEIARKMKAAGISGGQIQAITGLPPEAVEGL